MSNRNHHTEACLATLALAFAGVWSPAAWADPAGLGPAPSVANAEFRKVDSNRSGYVSLAEFRARGFDTRAFREGDTNHDGRLDPEEFVKAISIEARIRSGQYFDDLWITANVKASLLKDALVKSLNIAVHTLDGVVHLSGTLGSSAEIRRVLTIASRVNGVKGVNDRLVCKRDRVRSRPTRRAGASGAEPPLRPAESRHDADLVPAATLKTGASSVLPSC